MEVYAIEKHKSEYLTSTAKFSHVWIFEIGAWKLVEGLSYDHKVFEKPINGKSSNHKIMRNKLILFVFGSLFFLSSFTNNNTHGKQPASITRTTKLVNGNEVEKTVILLDRNTSREDVIYTCGFLANENVQLTFDKLIIGKSFLGLVGKNRIRVAEGTIKLSNGSSQTFKAGGAFSFKTIKIQYSNTVATKSSQIEMVEIID